MKKMTGAYMATVVALIGLAPHTPARAAVAQDYNVGTWSYVCRVQQIGTQETITVGSDSTWDAGVCAAFYDAPTTDYNQGYDFYPLAAPRPGDIVCSYVYRYGGYWERLSIPYANNTGAAIITVRDTIDDMTPIDGNSTYGQVDCGSIEGQLDSLNAQAGYNDVTHPLATVDYCMNCGGGGGAGPSAGFAGQLPKPPRARHPHKKPARRCTAGACPTPTH